MRPVLWLSPVALLMAGCLSTSARHIAPSAVIGATAAPVVVHPADVPAGASTFALASTEGSATPALRNVVTGLLERRGWSAAPREAADVVVDLSAGEWSRANKNGRDFPTPVEERRLAIRLQAPDSAWAAEMHSASHAYMGPEGVLRLALSAADQLPGAAQPSRESRALTALGADFVVVDGTGSGPSAVLIGVVPGSAAASAGWRPRDILVTIGGQPIAGAGWREIAARLGAATTAPLQVEVSRDGKPYLTYLVPSGSRPAA
jgi:membrane-associated protease RseP (regulator of RpoE activity)